MPIDFRETRDKRIEVIKRDAEKHGVPADVALKMAEQRMERAMPRVVAEREKEGRSRPIEINTGK